MSHREELLTRVGRDLHAALPGASRHPVKALDAKGMELASRDAELRAALFRLVDVTPACRSLDDLALHLAEYLDEVDERPQALQAAMRVAHRRLGPAGPAGPAVGVWWSCGGCSAPSPAVPPEPCVASGADHEGRVGR